jgi:hypothetical protein
MRLESVAPLCTRARSQRDPQEQGKNTATTLITTWPHHPPTTHESHFRDSASHGVARSHSRTVDQRPGVDTTPLSQCPLRRFVPRRTYNSVPSGALASESRLEPDSGQRARSRLVEGDRQDPSKSNDWRSAAWPRQLQRPSSAAFSSEPPLVLMRCGNLSFASGLGFMTEGSESSHEPL